MSRDEFSAELLSWLQVRFTPAGPRLSADTALFATKLIDSIRILEIIAWVELATGRRIPDSAIRMDNFRSVERIADAFASEASHVAG